MSSDKTRKNGTENPDYANCYDWYTPNHASKFLRKNTPVNVTARTIRRWCNAGKLPSKKVGNRHYIHRRDLLDIGGKRDSDSIS